MGRKTMYMMGNETLLTITGTDEEIEKQLENYKQYGLKKITGTIQVVCASARRGKRRPEPQA